MHKTKIVTTFLTNSDKILLLKRSQKVKSMKNLWAGISGIIEGDEKPVKRAKIEVCLLYTSPSPRDQRGSRMPSSA